MKNKAKKMIVIFVAVLILTNVILGLTNNSQANSNTFAGFNQLNPVDIVLPLGTKVVIKLIIDFLKTIAILTSIVVLTILGVKFIVGSLEEKADYKKDLVNWTIGVLVVCISIGTIPSFVYDLVTNENDVEIEVAKIALKLDQYKIILNIGETEEATINAIIEAENEEDINQNVIWTSTNPQVATVDSNGKVKAIAVGVTYIKATVGEVEATCQIIVESSKTMSVTLSEYSITLDAPIEITHKLKATIMPTTSIEPLYWSSSDNSVATVRDGVIRAKGEGTAVITAKSGNKSATCTVQVNSMHMFAGRFYNPTTNTVSPSRTSNKDLEFLLYMPEVSAVKDVDKLSLVVYLHGGQLESVYGLKNNNPFGLQNENVKYGAVFIFPISPYQEGKYGWMQETNERYSTLKSLMDYSTENYNVDKNKIALTGFSNGGGGVWRLGIKYPRFFSCLVPVSGYRCEEAAEYPDCPVWAICSSGDSSAAYAQRIQMLITNANGKVKYDNLGKIPHSDMQKKAYTPDVINWMIERSRKTNSSFEF